MVLGPCTCSTRLCENTLNVHGCQSRSTGDYFCDGDQLFSDVNTFVYNKNGDRACNVEGGPTSLFCDCSARFLEEIPEYDTPVNIAQGGFWPITAGKAGENHLDYLSGLPLGPCQCDLALVSTTETYEVL